MQLQLFLNNDLAIHFYYSEDSLVNGVISVEKLFLIFPGLPQFTEKDFFKDKIDKGMAFMYVYYYGSYYSGGIFSFANCQKSIRDAIGFAKKGRGIKTYDNKPIKWLSKKIVLVANSFGASPVLTSSISKKDVESIILISPLIFVYGNDIKKILSKAEIKDFNFFNRDFLGFMRRGYKNIYRGIIKENWDRYFLGKSPNSKIVLKSNSPLISVFHGKNDEVVNPKNSIFLRDRNESLVKLSLVDGVGHDFKALFKLI